MTESKRLRVLFLCTGNACRSQMAEGFCRTYHAERIDACSAGTVKRELDPLAVAVMAELGIDISGQASKTVVALADLRFDYVVTVCSHAHASCPIFPGSAQVVHRGFDDPPALAAEAIDKAQALRHYRRVRDEIKAYVLGLPESLAAVDHA